MAEDDLTDRVAEQVAPILETIIRRMESELTDRDKAAIAHGVVEAAMAGARVAVATALANAAEAGIDISGVSVSGLESRDLWPFSE